ncbi:MAG: hypothetical protein HPY83_11315 [Anaerolineae bacterium]|nr:hypothetical protein [Anaerolineae bacterium]
MYGIGKEAPAYIWHYDYYLSGNAPDAFAAYDPDRVADEIASTGANFAAIFALNQHGYAYYPSKIAPMHPYLGGRDYTGTLLEALQRRGITVITYVNFMNIERREAHPEWWQRAADGSQIYAEGWGVPCPNSPIREYMASIVAEVARLYPTNGFFFDMYAFNRYGCWCDYCRARFAEKYDWPFPIKEDWGSESWRKFIQFRQESAIATMKFIRDAAKAQREGLIWVTHCGPDQNWAAGTGTLTPQVDDMLQKEIGTRRGKGNWSAGQVSKILRPYARGQQVVTILADIHFYWDKPKGWFYTPWSVNQVKRQVAEIIAQGAWPDIYTEPFPDSRNDPHTIEGIKAAFDMAREVEPYLLGRETVKSVGLHYSRSSLDFFGKDDPSNYRRGFDGAYKALMEAHVPFDIVLDEQILDGSISQYDLLVLSNSACTSDEVNQALRQYVDGGGALIATYRTSLYDEHGLIRKDFGLADLLGVSHRLDLDRGYIKVDGELNRGLSSSPIIQHRIEGAVAQEDAEVLGKVLEQSPTDLAPFTYVSAPAGESDWPAVVRRGKVIYLAPDVGFSYMRAGYPDHLQLLTNAVQALVGDRLPLKLQAPTTVDLSLWKQGDRWTVHLVNLTTKQIVEDADCEVEPHEVIPVHDLKLYVRREGGFRRAFRARDGLEYSLSADGDWLRVDVPKLELYEVVVLEP